MGTTVDVIVDAMWREGAGQVAIRLVAADGGNLPAFEAGAHVDLHLAGGLVRQYSIASSPAQPDCYTLCVKREVASRGGSASVHDVLRVGETLRIAPPRSAFGLGAAARHVLIAGGIGITPILSMAEALAARGAAFELHYYVSTRAQVAFAKRLAAGFTDGQVEIHVSAEGDSPRGALPDAVTTYRSDARLYQCGPAAMMAHVRQRALDSGWPEDRVHQEAFAAALVPVGDAGAFDVELARSGRVFSVPADRTIAQVLVEAGVEVSLSCEMGICGSCLTRVLDGEIDHRDEVTGGVGAEIALCCSRARSARLLLDL